jgi:sarcosine oxidase
MRTAEVVVIGGGAVGSATAHALTRLGVAGAAVTIVERDTTYAKCSTARSAGGVRQQFSTPENIALSQATLSLLRNLVAEFGPDASLPFKEQGYLLMASAEGRTVLEENVALQRAHGADIEVVEGRDLATRFPWLVPDGVACASYGRSGEGWIDPVGLMTMMRRAAVAEGTRIVHGEVTAIERTGGTVSAVRIADGRRIACSAVVNAAGYDAGRVAAMAGIVLPVEPRKRYVYVIDSRRATQEQRLGPLTVDPSGVWYRPEGRTFICGVSPDEKDEPAPENLDDIDHRPFEEVVWPMLAARVPAFEEAKVLGAWAGFYDYNTLDQNAIIGAHPEVGNFYFANGFSGHGLQQSYAAGRAVAELIVYGGYRSIDLTRFGYDRIARRAPLLERNVI